MKAWISSGLVLSCCLIQARHAFFLGFLTCKLTVGRTSGGAEIGRMRGARLPGGPGWETNRDGDRDQSGRNVDQSRGWSPGFAGVVSPAGAPPGPGLRVSAVRVRCGSLHSSWKRGGRRIGSMQDGEVQVHLHAVIFKENGNKRGGGLQET